MAFSPSQLPSVRSLLPLSDFPAQPLFAEPGHPFLFCVCLSDFSRGEEILPFPQRAREISVESRTGARQRKKTIFEEDCFEEEKKQQNHLAGFRHPISYGHCQHSSSERGEETPVLGSQLRDCLSAASSQQGRYKASYPITQPLTIRPSHLQGSQLS